MKTDLYDIQQRLDILTILYKDVLSLENETLGNKLLAYKTDNVQWVLTALHPAFQELDYVLEAEESNYYD